MSDLEKIETTYDESQIQVLEGLDSSQKTSGYVYRLDFGPAGICITWCMKSWTTRLMRRLAGYCSGNHCGDIRPAMSVSVSR